MAINVLYLRTVYWFNLTSGGSVGHTAGVINSLSKKVGLTIISNDKLTGIQEEVHIIKPVCLKIFPPGYNEFLYNYRLKSSLMHYIKDADFIYQRYSGFSFIGANLAKKTSKTFVLEFNSSDVWKLKNWSGERNIIRKIFKILIKRIFFLPVVKRIEEYNLKNASLIVVVSEVLKKQLLDRGIQESKILVNPNGVDIQRYKPTVSGREVREKCKINSNETVIGFIGTFGQWHGVLEMAHAIVLFFQKYELQNVKFLLIGKGTLLNDTVKIITDAGLNDNVIFTGQVPQEEGPEYLAACDILLSPHIPNPDGTKFFGSPTKLFEYMAMGKAIIASNLFQIGEILTHRETGLLTEPGSIEELTRAMFDLINDKELRERLGENARKQAEKSHTWDKHVENILERINYGR